MHIDIAQRLRPFSHRPGTYAILPNSQLRVQIFPTRFVVADLSITKQEKHFTMDFDFTGPVEEFTVQQDLEKGDVVVWGRAQEGFFRYRINSIPECFGVAISFEKLPPSCQVSTQGLPQKDKKEICAGNRYVFIEDGKDERAHQADLVVEKLSLGSHKAQDWEQICRREDFSEIFPLWHRLGNMVQPPVMSSMGFFTKCEEAIASGDASVALKRLREVFLACFDSMLSPRLTDPYYQGIALPKIPTGENASPLAILSYGSHLIRSLFVQVHGNEILLLPSAPPEFHAGRFIDVACGDWGLVSCEWTKKAARRVILVANKDMAIVLKARGDQKSCRVKHSTKDRGSIYTLGQPIVLVKGQKYWFDNFRK